MQRIRRPEVPGHLGREQQHHDLDGLDRPAASPLVLAGHGAGSVAAGVVPMPWMMKDLYGAVTQYERDRKSPER